MPKWSPPPEEVLADALTQAWLSLNRVIEDSPPFEEVTGASVAQLQRQAVEAVATLGPFQREHGMGDADAMSYLYILGFTVGTIYGRNNHETNRTQAG